VYNPNVGVIAGKSQALEWEQARQLVVETVRQARSGSKVESIPLAEAHGRILASDLIADRDYPPVARSLRDGFAVHSSETPGTFSIQGELRAGEAGAISLPSGCAIEIMTGAPTPADADAVVMIETVAREGDKVTVKDAAKPGQFINVQGAEARKGATLVPAGMRLDASHIATLAMTGHQSVNVYRKPVVAILPTGDELVEVADTPAPHQIRNSNSYALAALVRAAGGSPVILPVAPDTKQGLTALLEQGLQQDLLLISGGVSAGKYDLVKPCLRDLGAEFFFERVRIQPGQPTAFGHARGRFVFGLPGNPGSSMVTFHVFARAALELLSGQADAPLQILYAVFEAPFSHKRGLTRFLPAHLQANGRLLHIPWQGSSDVPALAKANAFLIADADREQWNAGDPIRVMLKL
jgi:molybdopterin molybdotransferase